MWEARARYADGSEIDTVFEDDPRKSDGEMQYEIECWLIERDAECVWYSVNYVYL